MEGEEASLANSWGQVRWAFGDGKGACAWSSGIWCLGAVGIRGEKRLQRQAGLSIPSRAPWTVWRSARLTSLHAHSGCYVAEGLKNESEVYTVVFEGSTMYSHSLLFLIFWQIFGADTGVDIPPGRLYLWQLPLEMWTGSNCISFEFFFFFVFSETLYQEDTGAEMIMRTFFRVGMYWWKTLICLSGEYFRHE